ncbi:hypothetical protein BVC71_00155 [Marivivens niveibacter]|uniref:Uncharacterized protein n=2 Tax=Marivivens niveibacter TaxID=1930667 RepID=A0A251X1D3_9RHOB|nr:hypothetical protein BVC71_00155 [Marivivens niveibacter]
MEIVSLPVGWHVVLTVGSFFVFGFCNAQLTQSYVSSQFPVHYAVGQTAFDGDLIKGYYAHMQDQGTLGVYLRTQFIDFVFIASMVTFGVLLSTLVARIGVTNGRGQKIAYIARVSIIAGGALDVAENLMSFLMLSNATGFPNWIAIIYSSFAAMKFGCITVAMAAVLLAFFVGVTERLFTRRIAA